jgi:hypothetical protein
MGIKKRTDILTIAIFTLLVMLVSGLQFVDVANANFVIPITVPMEQGYIRSNGDVEPSTLPIQRSGNTYLLSDNIQNCSIEIQKDNIIFDGNNFSLIGPYQGEKDLSVKTASSLVIIMNSTGTIVKNVNFVNYFTALTIVNSSNIIIIQNNMNYGITGIGIVSCVNCQIIANNLTNNANTGLSISKASFLNILYNTISKNHQHGATINELIFSNISGNNICNNLLFSSPGLGIYFYAYCSNNYVFENNFIGNSWGILYQGTKNSSANNKVFNNYWNNLNGKIGNVCGDDISGIDESPHYNPFNIQFHSNLFPFPSPTITPSPSLSPPPTLEPTQAPIASPSSTHQPTLEPTMMPSSSPMGPYSPLDPYIILIPILIALVAVIAPLVYVKKHEKQK